MIGKNTSRPPSRSLAHAHDGCLFRARGCIAAFEGVDVGKGAAAADNMTGGASSQPPPSTDTAAALAESSQHLDIIASDEERYVRMHLRVLSCDGPYKTRRQAALPSHALTHHRCWRRVSLANAVACCPPQLWSVHACVCCVSELLRLGPLFHCTGPPFTRSFRPCGCCSWTPTSCQLPL